jgi:chitinase
MSPRAYLGIAVTAGDPAATADAEVTDVVIRRPLAPGPGEVLPVAEPAATPPAPNQPPAVSITAPLPSSVFRNAASITVEAAASDRDGSVSRVDFYAAGSLIASDTTAPYSVTWSGMAPGAYALTAVAVDDRGASTTSAGVDVLVRSVISSPTAPFTLLFTPPADQDTGVSYYVMEIHREGDPLAATPVVIQDLGKPAGSGTDIQVDVTSTISSLAPGTYYAAVTAYGAEGWATSDPSPVFSR